MKKLIIILSLFLSACATPFSAPSEESFRRPFPHLTESVQTTLHYPSFSNQSLNDGGLAILGILKGGPEGLRQNAAFELFQGLRASFPLGRIVPRADLVKRARRDGRFDELNRLLKSYNEDRVMDKPQLRRWAKLEGVRYFFIAQVPFNDKHTVTRMMQHGEAGVGGKVSVFSAGPEHISTQVEKKITLVGEVWDATCAKLVWKGTGRTEISEPVRLERARVEDMFTMLTRKLIAEMDRTMWEKGEKTLPETGAGSAC